MPQDGSLPVSMRLISVVSAPYTGVHAGLVIGVADDAGMHSSQNEQDSRHYAQASKLSPVSTTLCEWLTRVHILSSTAVSNSSESS